MAKEVGRRFRAWVTARRPTGSQVLLLDDEKIRLETSRSVGEVNFYAIDDDHEICELRITRRTDDDASFFLHFMLEDLDRAKELFDEMAEVLVENEQRQTTRVLLSCTSAMTTTYFANRMGEVAHTLNLAYEFGAKSIEAALADTAPYDAILLAPQVAHRRREMARAHPEALVFEIPGKLFGSYDAASTIRLLMHALRDDAAGPADGDGLRPMRDLRSDYRILVLTLFAVRSGARLGYRVYHGERVVSEGDIRKSRLDFRDVEDLIATLVGRGIDVGELDAIGIAVPGIVTEGVVHLQDFAEGGLDLGPHLSERFGVPVFVDNNCNAAAVACYVSQRDYESVMFFRQELGHEAGGLGTVVAGRLLRGKGCLAGEPKFFERRFSYEPYAGYDDARWTFEGMFQIACNVTLASIALTAPEAVFLAVDTLDDEVAFRAELAREVGDRFVPQVFLVDDYVERVYLGEMALSAKRLRGGSHL